MQNSLHLGIHKSSVQDGDSPWEEAVLVVCGFGIQRSVIPAKQEGVQTGGAVCEGASFICMLPCRYLTGMIEDTYLLP